MSSHVVFTRAFFYVGRRGVTVTVSGRNCRLSSPHRKVYVPKLSGKFKNCRQKIPFLFFTTARDLRLTDMTSSQES